MTTDPAPGNRYLAPGTKVRLDSLVNDNDEVTSELGIVVHCWLEETIGFYRCYIAFFGDELPSGRPDKVPYVLAYTVTSLKTVT